MMFKLQAASCDWSSSSHSLQQVASCASNPSQICTHEATIAVCVAEAGRDGEVRFIGVIPNEPSALDKLVARLGRGGRTLRFAYEAGPCGYGVYRHLRDCGHDCVVVAPSLIPRKPGERIKT
ncbi:hypothetical protein ACFQX4_12570, partial [Roseomonas sp. GCM10028921]